ncbi:hypothetical protein [Candidatus Poriferisodalis sp.]|uniref:hypothetical protein n=1 Tax=Candidatus Poriferisodalis sp. TaxID=3101277 RepID=UPI003B519419
MIGRQAESLAARYRPITDWSTPASAWSACPASILTRKSYFCSAESSLFDLRSGESVSRGLLN